MHLRVSFKFAFLLTALSHVFFILCGNFSFLYREFLQLIIRIIMKYFLIIAIVFCMALQQSMAQNIRCMTSYECPGHMACLGRKCYPGKRDADEQKRKSCLTNSDCFPGQVCMNLNCSY